jgi:predicted nuclease of predicted toxin-antitoxin system
MKVILDECIPQSVKKFLQEKGIDTSSVGGLNLPNRSDQMILDYARVGAEVFITCDRRMDTRNRFPPSQELGVIYLRVEPWSSKFLMSALEEFLQQETIKKVVGRALILRRHDWEFLE